MERRFVLTVVLILGMAMFVGSLSNNEGSNVLTGMQAGVGAEEGVCLTFPSIACDISKTKTGVGRNNAEKRAVESCEMFAGYCLYGAMRENLKNKKDCESESDCGYDWEEFYRSCRVISCRPVITGLGIFGLDYDVWSCTAEANYISLSFCERI